MQKFIKIGKKKSNELCCDESNVISCQELIVYPDLLSSLENEINILDTRFYFDSYIPPCGYSYINAVGDTALLTWNPMRKSLFGTLKFLDGR